MKNPKTTEHPFRTNQSARTRGYKGFALVVTLSLMVLLAVIAVSLLSLSSISLRASTQGQAVAQANARLALMLAIGDLQSSLGSDQRITAAAEILPAANPAAPGRAHWTGVWDTSTFNPATPSTKAFVRWLVSDSPSAGADATAAAATTDVQVFSGKDAATSVIVPKVTVNFGSYAYWVEDLGLKADLGWSEGDFTNNERKQSARLSAAPGPDHSSFDGPFSGKTNYPVTKTAGNPWLDNLDKALSVADMPLVMGDTADQSTWLRDRRHDMTLGSRGVLADSKKGGLRRDLSLAFEMDGTAEAEAATQFNLQAGEFVGNGDTLSAPQKPAGLPVNERFLWRDYATDNNSGIIMTKLNGSSPFNVRLDDRVAFTFVHSRNAQGGDGGRHEMDTSLPKGTAITPASLAADITLLGEQTQHILMAIWQARNQAIGDDYLSPGADPYTTIRVRNETVSALVNTKVIYGAHSLLIKPASPAAGEGTRRPSEMFARFNPAPSLMRRDYYNRCMPNQMYRHVTASSTFAVLNDSGIDFSGAARNTFWGLSYQSSGSIAVPMSNIPSGPLFSLAAFSDANLSIMGTDPFQAVGNSWSSPLIPPSSAYGQVKQDSSGQNVAQDFSWLLNDALFDRYTLSGIAPDFTIGGGGYSATGSLSDTLTKFFSADHRSAQANPVLRPHLPPGRTAAAVTAELVANDGYKKMAAYSLIDGAFNVNSTSVAAWTAFLRTNRNLAMDYAQNGGSDGSSGSPFPSSDSPVKLSGAKPQWSGFSRLSDEQVSDLATGIVAQVKLRGPFMSLSDFINHKMGPVDAAQSYTGALQAALDLEAAAGSGINAASRAAAGGSAPFYDPNGFNGPPVLGSGTMVTTGIPGDITQADLLLPLAPRLAARSDTFRIRGYGEARSKDGTQILARATCEAVVQRFPEYLDPVTDAANNEPWDEASPSGTTLNAINQKFGRRFKLIRFRWLSPSEI